jgi:prepilin-type N-terminal cleavage/methylation domain-containing protein
MTSRGRAFRAFTLVELLVVIGIIAVLIGILLPALAAARQSAQTVACSSNMRQIYAAARNYATEFKDSLPFGFIFNKSNPATGRPAGGDTSYITWFSSCDKYMSAKASEIILLDGNNNNIVDGSTRRNFSRAFMCPSVVPSEFKQQIQYYAHSVAMPWIPLELKAGVAAVHNNAPAKFTQLWPDNALFWDTPLWSDAGTVTPSMFWIASDTAAGAVLPASHIDGGQLLEPNHPELRYRGPGRDRFSQPGASPFLDPNKPIYWAADEALANGFAPTYNADFGGGTVYTNTIGGPRYRHGKKNTCVVAFADGSIRPLKLNKGRFFTTNHYDSEFLRRYIMLKWPSDKQDSGQVPLGG